MDSLVLSGLIAAATLWLSFLGYQIAKDRMMKELFESFNKKYNDLNDRLASILRDNKSLATLEKEKSDSLNTLNDYLNLCAEEYYWFKKKRRIDPMVWHAWHLGMVYWYKNLKSLSALWEKEKKNGNYGSYYLKDREDFFKS